MNAEKLAQELIESCPTTCDAVAMLASVLERLAREEYEGCKVQLAIAASLKSLASFHQDDESETL